MGLAATFTMFPALAGKAQSPSTKPLRGLDAGPITWRNIRTDFGAVGDGVTSDFVAFRAFRSWALAQSGWVGLIIPPTSGHYVTAGSYGGGLANAPFFGIKRLVVSGYGASMDGLHGAALINSSPYRHKIRSVNAGSRTVELIDRGAVRFLSVGSMVLLAGLDLQGGWGYPPNCHFNEWHRIASIEGGRVTFARPIKYDYRDDWPRYFEGHSYEMGGVGPAAICRTVPGWDCEHWLYGLRSTAKGQTYYFVRKAVLVDCRSDAVGWIIGASEDMRIINQQHTASHMEVDKLTTKALIGEYDPAGKNINVQSSSVDELTVRGGTRSVIGTARHTYIHGGERQRIWLGPTAYGISESIEIRDAVVTTEILGTPGMSVPLSELTFSNGTFRFANYKHPPQWFVPGAVGIIRSAGAFDHHVFRILRVRSENGQPNGPILLDTDIKGNDLPVVRGYANAAIVRHNAPNLTVVNCSGCPDAEELSLVPPNSPYGIFKRRTLNGLSANNPMGYLMGRLVHLKINVTKPYTGTARALNMTIGGQFGGWHVTADKMGVRTEKTPIRVNLKAEGERVITPKGVSGAQTGDTNLDLLTGGVWMPNNFGFGVWIGNAPSPVDISGEDPSVRPSITVEVLTDQEF